MRNGKLCWGKQISTKCLLQVKNTGFYSFTTHFCGRMHFVHHYRRALSGPECAFALNIGGVVLSRLSRVSTWKHIWRPDTKHGDHLKTSQKSKWICKSLYMSVCAIVLYEHVWTMMNQDESRWYILIDGDKLMIHWNMLDTSWHILTYLDITVPRSWRSPSAGAGGPQASISGCAPETPLMTHRLEAHFGGQVRLLKFIGHVIWFFDDLECPWWDHVMSFMWVQSFPHISSSF